MKVITTGSLRRSAVPLAVALTLAASVPLAAQFGTTRTDGAVQIASPFVTEKQGDKKEDEMTANPFSTKEETVDGRRWGILLANGKTVLGIPGPVGGLSAIKRAEQV